MPNQASSNAMDREERINLPDHAPENAADAVSRNSLEQNHHPKWKLKVQGVMLEFDVPVVRARDALVAAGFDPGKSWHIFLIVQDHPKQEISVDTEIDLRTPGIEKIRLMQRNVDNGDGQCPSPRRLFRLLDADQEYLDRLALRWETVVVDRKRWVVLYDYPLPSGFTPEKSTLALDIPPDYPASQIDMFYFHPWITRSDGIAIPSTQIRASIEGLEYQGWSRHRNSANPWDPNSDGVRTHLILVDSCLARESGQ